MVRSPSTVLLLLVVVSLVSLPPVHSFLRLYNMTRKLTDLVLGASFLNTEDMSTPVMVQKRGYPFETHYVQTEDGYILELHRIPHGKYKENFPRNDSRYPVIVQHGNFQSSADWLLNSPDSESLGFYLADKGYDVWLGNQRGNEYSLRHKLLPVHGNSYWNFSFHELGVYDLPAVIDYVTSTSGKKKTHYISFSLGSTAFFAGLSKRPEYSDKIGVGVVMGPSTFQANFWHGWVQLFSPVVWLMQVFQRYAGDMPVLPQFVANLLHKILPIICHPKLDVFSICVSVVQLSMGNDRGKITKERLHVVTKVSPSSSSMKAFLHEMQLMGTGRFCEYDYGTEQNMAVYGKNHPPDYNLTNVRTNIALIVGPNDFLAHKEDAQTLASKLPNVVDFHYVPDQHFTHLDFCYATGVASLVYEHIVNLLRRFDNR